MYLAALRTKAGLSQVQAAQALNVSQSAITQWETGKMEPRKGKIPLIAEAYGATVEAVLDAIRKDKKEANA